MEKKVKGLYLNDGKCVCKPNFLVPGLIPKEEAVVEIIGKKDDYFLCQIQNITKASDNRIEPICPYKSCGGCDYSHISYNAQLEYKTDYISVLFKEFNVKVNKTLGMDDFLGSRHKVIATFGMKKNKIISGIYEENSHKIVDITNCPIQNKEANDLIKEIKNIFTSLKIEPFNEDTGRGLVRHVYIRTGYYTREIMVVVVTASEIFPNRSVFVKKLLDFNPNIKTVVQNINSRKTSIVFGDKLRILYGDGYIKDSLLGLEFNISSQSFYQVNPKQTEVLYQEALRMANLNKNDIVFDAYCGIGTISLLAARKAKKVIGVEIVKDAIKDAINNAKMNNIKNAYFVCDDASNYLDEMAKNHQRIDCLFMDPPRKGSDYRFIKALKKIAPKRIIYISCGPDTQVRDLKMLIDMYKVEEVQPVDLFCQTHHVETVTLLTHTKN